VNVHTTLTVARRSRKLNATAVKVPGVRDFGRHHFLAGQQMRYVIKDERND
jgi:hypothetical protein